MGEALKYIAKYWDGLCLFLTDGRIGMDSNAVERTIHPIALNRKTRCSRTMMQAPKTGASSHHYMFEAGGANWGVSDPDFGGDDLPANKTTSIKLIEDTGARSIRYIYDFGDSWEHKLEIGKITDLVPGRLYPRLSEI